MLARMITRCGCERLIEITSPPPPVFVMPLKPRSPNGGLVRPWLNNMPQRYDHARDGLAVRRFKISLESLEGWTKNHHEEVWYDEECDTDESGFDADKRTYALQAK